MWVHSSIEEEVKQKQFAFFMIPVKLFGWIASQISCECGWACRGSAASSSTTASATSWWSSRDSSSASTTSATSASSTSSTTSACGNSLDSEATTTSHCCGSLCLCGRHGVLLEDWGERFGCGLFSFVGGVCGLVFVDQFPF